MTAKLQSPISFLRGPDWPNAIGLSPLTNQQSGEDGILGQEEYDWLTMRGAGGFGMVMTCAALVSPEGYGFTGQLGIYGDQHLDGLKKLATGVKAHGAVAIVQLHHAGFRAIENIQGLARVAPCAIEEEGILALTKDDIARIVEDFATAAHRAELAGFDGVEVHGAHGYLLAQFLDQDHNKRADEYGGNDIGRARIYHEVLGGVRAATGPDFQVGLRLSPERWGINFDAAINLAKDVMAPDGAGRPIIDFLDMSLWDCFAPARSRPDAPKPLIDYFAALPRNGVRLFVAGKIGSGQKCAQCMGHGADGVLIGRAAIAHHEFARQVLADENFIAKEPPFTKAYLKGEGLSDIFIGYMDKWPGFVAKD